MITEDVLAKEYLRIVGRYYPKIGELLDGCYVKVITSYWGRPPKRLRYIGIYCSTEMMPHVQAHKQILRDVAENMGLVQVVFRNASRLLRDPKSTIKDSDPRMWLDLQWVVT
ncbi:hypothetical protein [Calothrix sp. 336/3]|uniref:hypothetical protein n=1 Tax=Calothrix sp. 336/3 TaxID=1337936 RepID=UPI0004E3BE40|nr:hypothetical protein [Calothrix sp. 336/3]AKG23830.1 hypothetical protein IJ00_23275 [Calothrix sp. 336/3]